MTIHIVKTINEKVWRSFVDQHPEGNIFHTPEMYQVFSHSKGYQPEFRGGVDDYGQLLALLPLVRVSLRDNFLSRLTSRSIAYGGVLSTTGPAGQEALAALLQDQNRRAGRISLFTEIRHLSSPDGNQATFTNCGYSYQNHLNYLIDLDCSPEEVFNRFGAHARRHIRQEMKKGQVMIDEVHDFDQVKIIYELLKKSYLAAKIPLADISLFESAFEVLYPKNMVRFWLARTGDTYIASSVELVYKDVIYGWYGGVDREYSRLTPNEILTWHILKWGAENGYRLYDFGGAGNPDEEYGVRDFKAKFGGQLVCYGRNTCVHSPALLQLSKTGYSFLRRFITM